MNKKLGKQIATTLISRIQSGEKKAVSELYENYKGALFGVCVNILKDRKRAEDALQKSFVKIWKKAKLYDPSKGKPYTWMLNITRNTAIDIYRSESRKKTIQDEELNVHLIDSVKSTENNPDTLDLKDKVGKLEQKYRAVLRLSYLGGYTQKEISKHLKIPLGTVKTRMRTAIQKLRKIYDK
jgi:RNA polymerase sigma-70 factor (ECF subfamily)